MVCVGLSERDLLQWHDVTRKIFGGHWGGRQNLGGHWPPLAPPLPGDDLLSSHWHSVDCQFIRGTDNTNLPFGTTFENQRTQNISSMLTTVARGSTTSGEPHTSLPGALTSEMSRSKHDVLVTTALTSTNTVSTSSNVATSQNTNAANASPIFEQLAQLIPCSNPVNPHMRSSSCTNIPR